MMLDYFMTQEPDIRKIRNKVNELVNEMVEKTSPTAIQHHQTQTQGLSAYLSSYDTQQLIKWNKWLAIATTFLALCTFFLVLVTIFKA
jgi:hypothetical protein